jgi:hypothetical protein
MTGRNSTRPIPWQILLAFIEKNLLGQAAPAWIAFSQSVPSVEVYDFPRIFCGLLARAKPYGLIVG